MDCNQILKDDKDLQVFLVGGPKMCPQIQDCRQPPSTANRKIAITPQPLDEILHNNASGTSTPDQPLKF